MASKGLAFLTLTLGLGIYWGAPFAGTGDPRAHLPGRTTSGHAQIEEACGQCHTPFEGATTSGCNRCHGTELTEADDSHPASKFLDPRNAERSKAIDATDCATCHVEHAPARARTGGVTLPKDFCFRCHEDVGTERPSHAGFDRDGCASAGCHNFHDNRALYEDFLVKNAGLPAVLPDPRVPVLVLDGDKEPSPDPSRCGECHAEEHASFVRGRHGMRLAVGLDPMTPSKSTLPFTAQVMDRPLGCTSCHGAHTGDTARAAVEACLDCHADEHSRAYVGSKHHALWKAEQEGRAPKGSGVSCATCHLPREVTGSGDDRVVRVRHDQNANLRPSTKMIRSVCMSCHGLELSIDALADRDLVARNFDGPPTRHVESVEMAVRRKQPRPKN
ncbi:cytochrome c3 family protein [Myxococcota bacterium]|nr:cytochrome c3 family protein [Myxococcota bacterium]